MKVLKDFQFILPDDTRREETKKFLMTTLILRRVKFVIKKAGFTWRPYIFRAYFRTYLDIAKSKGMISNPWRQFIMGHKGDMEETHTKREGMVNEGRLQYQKCLQFLETQAKPMQDG